MTMEVSEIFGPTLQGEGPSLGTPAMFLRLRRCNLQCTWCDTKYTWDPEHPGFKSFKMMNVREIINALTVDVDYVPPLLVITGGEPLIWGTQLRSILPSLLASFDRVEIETNGMISPTVLGHHIRSSKLLFNVSPKLKGAGMGYETLKWDIIEEFLQVQSTFKFVIKDIIDWQQFMQEIRPRLPKERVTIMPEGSTTSENLSKMKTLFHKAAENNVKLTPRLHTLAFGNQQGI